MKRSMRRVPVTVATAAFLCAVVYSGAERVGAAQGPVPVPSASAPQRALIDSYCLGCHNQRARVGGLALDTMDLSRRVEEPRRLGEGHPKASRRHDASARHPPAGRAAVDDLVIAGSRARSTRRRSAHPEPGTRRAAPVESHRVRQRDRGPAGGAHRSERASAGRRRGGRIRQRRQRSEGFAVVPRSIHFGGALVSSQALGIRRRGRCVMYRPTARNRPERSPGGPAARHARRSAGRASVSRRRRIQFNISGLAVAGYVGGMEYRHTVIVTIDGVKVFEGTIGGEEDLKAVDQQQARRSAAINARFQNIPVTVKAGPHKVGVTFVARTFAESDEILLLRSRRACGDERIPRVGGLEVVGPFSPAGLGDTPSRRRIFVCRPAQRRRGTAVRDSNPVDARPARVSPTRHRAGSGRRRSRSIEERTSHRRLRSRPSRMALTTILASPKFLYRTERLPANRGAGLRPPHHRSGPRVAAVVLPVGPVAGR